MNLDATCWTCLELLTARVRVIAQQDLAELGVAPATLWRLESAQLLAAERVLISLLPLAEPVHAQEPDDPPPPFGELAYRLRRRWEVTPSRTVIVWRATDKAARVTGSRCSFRRDQVQHDVHVGRVYARRYAGNADWVGEDAYRLEAVDGKVPDACLAAHGDLAAEGEPYRLIEFGGNYPAERLERFAAFAEKLGVAWELW